MNQPRLLRALPAALAGAASLFSIGCAGPMTSTAVLQDRGQDGGTVRIVVPSYPPDSDTQAKASKLVGEACGGRSWKFVDMAITDAKPSVSSDERNSKWVWWAGYGGMQAHVAGDLKPKQQVDLKFACVAK